MKNKYSSPLYILIILLIIALLSKCANKVPPKGGPMDTIPPTLIYSNPENKSKNVHLRVFEFGFDERIQLNKLKQQLIITPRIDFEYEVKTGKRNFILIFEEDFADSVTYTFNFRDAIQDITEGNPTKDNIFTFSTGDVLDSLHISGYAVNLISKDSIKGATIGLYRTQDTINIFNGSPYYFTETDEEGKYTLENIKNGQYRLYGFVDDNGNLTLESNSESYGFYPDTINLQNHIDSLNIQFYQLDLRELKLTSANPSGKNFDVNFNKYILNYEVKPIDKDFRIFTNKAKENKSVRIYRTFENKDSTGVYIKVQDSLRQTLEDTVWVKFTESSKKPEEFTMSITPDNNAKIQEKYSAEIQLSKPFKNINTDSILFRYDTVTLNTIKSKSQVYTNKHYNKLYLLFELNKRKIDSTKQLLDSLYQSRIDTTNIAENDTLPEPGNIRPEQPQLKNKKTIGEASAQQKKPKGLHLYFGKGAIVSIEDDSIPDKILNYSFTNPEENGIISGQVSTSYPSYILQLLSASNKVVKEIYSQEKFTFRNLQPGEYRLRLLIDMNENGRWDYGNMKDNEAPEPVVYYYSPDGILNITVRANWEISDINFRYE